LGSSTEDDVIEFDTHEDRLYELVDGLLVEKTMGSYESILAAHLLTRMMSYVLDHGLGTAMGADGIVRLMPGIVRIPDACFISQARLSQVKLREQPIASVVPDLVIEVISQGNTAEEMQEKLADYFAAGVRSVWYVYWRTETVEVFHSPSDRRVVQVPDPLEDESVLPGFRVDLAKLFAQPA
jgi:Uma2 family endonuclease